MPAHRRVGETASGSCRSARKPQAVKGSDQVANTRYIDGFIDCRSELGRSRKAFRIPAHVFARNPRADLGPVMQQHLFIMRQDDIEPLLHRRVGNPTTAPEPLDDLMDEPWPPIAPAPIISPSAPDSCNARSVSSRVRMPP